jgi:hypothetical protein
MRSLIIKAVSAEVVSVNDFAAEETGAGVVLFDCFVLQEIKEKSTTTITNLINSFSSKNRK